MKVTEKYLWELDRPNAEKLVDKLKDDPRPIIKKVVAKLRALLKDQENETITLRLRISYTPKNPKSASSAKSADNSPSVTKSADKK